MSTGRSDTSSKRKRSTPQKFKSRKIFPSSRHDLLEQPEFSRPKDGGSPENQLSKLPVTLQNKENMPEKCPNGSVTASRGRGRPKGSKNKTFPTLPSKVYDVREGKSSPTKTEGDTYSESPPRTVTPHRGRGRPRGSTKIKIEQNTPRNPRGRPKGSKNKKPSKAKLIRMLPSGVKLGRGRPRKVPHPNAANEMLTPKRGRGRPKGSLNKVSSAKRLSVVSLVSGTREVKKRGRPRKNILLHKPIIVSLAPKRPRGRPRKKIYSAVPSHPSDHESSGVSDSFVVKKRGRPKKIILHPTIMILAPKRPRGRPRKTPIFQEVPQIQDHEVKSSESNTEDEDNMDSEDDHNNGHENDHDRENDNYNENDNDNDDDDDDDDDKKVEDLDRDMESL